MPKLRILRNGGRGTPWPKLREGEVIELTAAPGWELVRANMAEWLDKPPGLTGEAVAEMVEPPPAEPADDSGD